MACNGCHKSQTVQSNLTFKKQSMSNVESSKCNISLYFCNIDYNTYLVIFKYRLPTESIPNNFPTALGIKVILTVIFSRYFWQCQKIVILLDLYSSILYKLFHAKTFEEILNCVSLHGRKDTKFPLQCICTSYVIWLIQPLGIGVIFQ